MDQVAIFCAKYLIGIEFVLFLFSFRAKAVQRKAAIYTALVLPLTYISGKVLNHLYYNPRPFVVQDLTPLIAHVADNGFPSDHVLLASALASVASLTNKRLGSGLWILTIIIAWARVYAGVHHPFDVVGSMLISVIITLVVYFFYGRRFSAVGPTKTE